jgi:hypothetical protein
MNSELINARHLVELGYLEAIVQNLGYGTHLIEASASVPYHTLSVQLEPDSQGRTREMSCTFYPLSDEETPNLLLLQYFLELPFEITQGAHQPVNELLMVLNNKTVLGHFGIAETQKRVHHRYIQTLPASDLLAEEATADVVTLFNFTSLMMGKAIEAVATQQKSPQEAIAMMPN